MLLFRALCTMILVGSLGLSQENLADRSTDILVFTQPGAVQIEEGREAASIDESMLHAELLTVLERHGAERVIRAIPDFDASDLTRISPSGKTVQLPNFSRLYRFRFPAGADLDGIVTELMASAQVVYAERLPEYRFFSTYPNDEHFHYQWGLFNTGQEGGTPGADIGAPEAWDYEKGSASVKIGIIDTGVKRDHTDLSGKVSGEQDFSDAHGTHVASIAAAKTDNTDGMAGVSWYSPIHSEDVFGFDPAEIYYDILDAVDAGCYVLNNSWGGSSYSIPVRSCFAYIYRMNRVAVAAMGNDDDVPQYPAAFGHGVLAVGSIKNDGSLSIFSNYGNHIDIVAPGGTHANPPYNDTDILSTWTISEDTYCFVGGTSEAAPFVTGVAALLKSYRPELDNDDVMETIKLSGTDRTGELKEGWDQEYGHGLVNAYHAIKFLKPPYSLTHEERSGGVSNGATRTTVTFIDVPGLADGGYVVDRHAVERDVTFGDPCILPPNVWGRGVWTEGYSTEDPNFGLGWAVPIEGTITNAGCRMRTYVYEVYTPLGVEWVPCEPTDVHYAYTVHGIIDVGPPDVTVTHPNGGEYYRSGNTVHITWEVYDQYIEGVSCDIELNFNSGMGLWTVVASGLPVDSDGNGSYDWKIPCGEPRVMSHCRIRAIATDNNEHADSDMSNADFTIEYLRKGNDWPDPHYGEDDVPECTYIDAPHPNPFNPLTSICFGVGESADVTMLVYDIEGRLVKTICREASCNPGHYIEQWNGRNDAGNSVTAGVYFLRFEAGDYTKTQKIVLIH